MPETRTVATSYLRPLLAAVEASGIAPPAVLEGIPLTMDQLMTSNTRLSIAKPSTFRALGLATLSCATLSHAIDLILRYQRLVSEAGLLSTEHLPDASVALVHTEQAGKHALLPQQIEALFAGLHLQSRSLTQRLIVPLAVRFRHPAQGDLEHYVACFGIAPQFGAAGNLLVLSAEDLRQPLPYADAELCRMHCTYADQQHATLPDTGYVASYAAQWLEGQTSGNVGVGDLAQALGMSVRNLQRALRNEGTSWTSLVDAARRSALQRLLSDGCSLDNAAQKLGYHDASSVSRAARRWFGESPKRWSRKQ